MADFDFKIKYRPGKVNVDADYLSRRSLEIEEMKAACTVEFDPREIEAVMSHVNVERAVMVNKVTAEQLVLKGETDLMVPAAELRAKQMED